MGRAPAYIFVVRHGNRLDAANKQWHLQSPTPYDPPLTYSGWNQARATGQRIGEILRERVAQDEAEAAHKAGNGSPRKKRRYNVVIHSSPFLRCVQTSVGISAGLVSIPEPTSPALVRASSTHSVTNPRPRTAPDVDIHPTIANSSSQQISDLPTPPDGNSCPISPSTKPTIEKTVLRLDAFLGEWLTPSYFELITAPPASSLMLASAKANLLRKEDYSSNPNFAAHNIAAPAWAQSPTATSPVNALDSVSSLAEALRRAGRSDSVTSIISNGESRLLTGGPYVPPTPAYAISHNAEIPSGYVPHARDNCCHMDYQWDSMRGTLDWGDGGTLGEEWTSMHKRFRKGLQKLVDWYSTAENPTQMVTKEKRASVADDYVMVDDEDETEIESVVIIVSHGAGCNALIGAITHQPVLTDVGLASLTEAVRKPGVRDVEDNKTRDVPSNLSDTVSEPSGLVAIHQYYDLKLFASNEHLGQGRLQRAHSVTAAAKPPSRGRLSSASFTSSPLGGFNATNYGSNGLFPLNKPEGRTAASTAGMRRESGSSSRLTARLGLNMSGLNEGITVGSGVTSFMNKTSAAGGLWSPLRTTLDTPDEEDDDFLPNFSSYDSAPSAGRTANKSEDSAKATLGSAAAIEPGMPSTTKHNDEPREWRDSTVSPRSNAIGNYEAKVDTSYDETREHPRPLRQLGSGAGGLWGSPRPLLEDEDLAPDMTSLKRRWTVSERL